GRTAAAATRSDRVAGHLRRRRPVRLQPGCAEDVQRTRPRPAIARLGRTTSVKGGAALFATRLRAGQRVSPPLLRRPRIRRAWRNRRPLSRPAGRDVAAAVRESRRIMALTATIYTIEIDLNDSDRGVYESLALRVARHPS